MRLWHQKLLPYLDRQRLLGQHRECAALRGKGWGKKHATVDYVFTRSTNRLVAYHILVMDEMKRRGYKPDETWYDVEWRGTAVGRWEYWASKKVVDLLVKKAKECNMTIYYEHDDAYLNECITLLKEKQAPIDWEKVEV